MTRTMQQWGLAYVARGAYLRGFAKAKQASVSEAACHAVARNCADWAIYWAGIGDRA